VSKPRITGSRHRDSDRDAIVAIAVRALAPGLCVMLAAAAADAQTAPHAVEGVVVTATRPREQVLLDRRVYAITSDLQAATGTAADVLNQIPSVDVDADGVLSLRGDAHVTVLVDGKPSAQFQGASGGSSLQQFPAADIDRIEVMTNPPAQYKAEGSAGVINIITRKTGRAGLSGTADLAIGDKRRFTAGLTGAYNMGRLKLSGGVTLRQDDKERRVTDARTVLDPASGERVASRQDLDEHLIRFSPSVKLGADYAFNDRQSASLSLSHREQTGKRFFLQQDRGGPPETASDRRSDGYEYNISEGEDFHFDQKLPRPDERLSFGLRRSVYRERERYAYVNDFTVPVAPSTQDRLRLSQDHVVLEASVDYSLPLGAGRSLKLGYDLEDDRIRSDRVAAVIDPADGALVDNPNITNHFRYHQRIHAVYAQFQAPFGSWTLQTGTRLQVTDVDFHVVSGDTSGTRSDVRLYPSLSLERALGEDSRLTLSLSRRVTQPDADALDPTIDSQDTHNLRAGNAGLLPQDTWSYEAGYASRFHALDYGLTAYYRFDRDTVVPLVKPVSADVTLATLENLPKTKSAGLDLSAHGKLGGRLSFAVSGALFYSQIDGGAATPERLRDTLGLNAKASLDWRPSAADTAQIAFSRTDRRLTPQGSVSAINLVNLGYRREIWSKAPLGSLSAVATVTDLFNGQRFERMVSTATLKDTYTRRVAGRIGYVGLRYTVGVTRKAKPAPFDFSTDPGR
jgi:outer membrane receptor protein involved in Fe transport